MNGFLRILLIAILSIATLHSAAAADTARYCLFIMPKLVGIDYYNVPVLKKAREAGIHVMSWDGDARLREFFVNLSRSVLVVFSGVLLPTLYKIAFKGVPLKINQRLFLPSP
jgi:hypothetical protein